MAFLKKSYVNCMQSLLYSELLIVEIVLIVFDGYLSILAPYHKASHRENPVSTMISSVYVM